MLLLNTFLQSLFLNKQSYFYNLWKQHFLKSQNKGSKMGGTAPMSRNRIEMSIERCKLLEMQLQMERRKVIALTERNVQLEKKLDRITKVLKELC